MSPSAIHTGWGIGQRRASASFYKSAAALLAGQRNLGVVWCCTGGLMDSRLALSCASGTGRHTGKIGRAKIDSGSTCTGAHAAAFASQPRVLLRRKTDVCCSGIDEVQCIMPNSLQVRYWKHGGPGGSIHAGSHLKKHTAVCMHASCVRARSQTVSTTNLLKRWRGNCKTKTRLRRVLRATESENELKRRLLRHCSTQI
jgi:hypothetical protein